MQRYLKVNEILLLIVVQISLFFLCSCTGIVSAILGINTNYEFAKREEVLKYAAKYHYDNSQLFFIDSLEYSNFRKSSFKPGWEPGFRPIQYKIFDKEGLMVSQYSSCEGSRKSNNIFETLPPKNITPMDSTYTFEKDLRCYKKMNGENINLNQFTTVDYNIVVYWATFTGIPGRKLIEDLEEYIKKYPEKKFNIIKINTDIIKN